MAFPFRPFMYVLALGAGAALAAQPPAPTPYLGQPAPGAEARLFAPGLLNRGLPVRDITFSPDGSECYFRVNSPGGGRAAIVGIRRQGEGWSEPEVPAFASDPRWQTMEPCISPDGARFLFVSNRPQDPQDSRPGPMGIWMMERTPRGDWGPPRRLPAHINGPDGTFFPSVTREGTLYFSQEGGDGRGIICRARWTGKEYGPAEALPPLVQCGQARYNPFVAADEGWLILAVQGMTPGKPGLDLAVLFRNAQGRWSAPQLLDAVNDPVDNVSASLSPDGRFLFFSSRRIAVPPLPPEAKLTYGVLEGRARRSGANGLSAIFWVDARVVERLRARAVFPPGDPR